MGQKSKISDISSTEIKIPSEFIKNRTETKQSDKRKATKLKERSTSFIKLFSYSDYWDILLMAIGTVASIAAAAIFPIIFYLYGQMSGTFVNYQKLKNLNYSLLQSSAFNETIIDTKSCLEDIPKNLTYYDSAVWEGVLNYVYFGIVTLALNYMSNVCWSISSERQIMRIRTNLYRSMIKQEVTFFNKYSSGELNALLINHVNDIKLGIGSKFADFIHIFGRSISCLILALVVAFKFSIVFIGLCALATIATASLLKRLKKCTNAEMKVTGKANRLVKEMLGHMRTVVTLGIQKKSIAMYEKILLAGEKLTIKKGLIGGLLAGTAMTCFNFIFGISIFYATYLERSDCRHYNAQNLIQCFFALVTATFTLPQSISYLKDLLQARISARQVFEIIEEKEAPELDEIEVKTKVFDLLGDIEFRNVSFAYPQVPAVTVIKDLSFKMPHGKTVAICGHSGCGKSTIISLLERLYTINSGQIEIDGVNIKDLDLDWLRNQMALVSQEPILFTTTIKENIRLGKLEATDYEIEMAAKSASAHTFIMNTPKQYDTQVGERGVQISGGQKQRIAIARALLRNPKILLLDESTSALDNENEKIVQEALVDNSQQRTTVIIAHRLSTIKNADLIFTMEDGSIKEQGSHEKLMALKGVYYNLVTAQGLTDTKSKPVYSEPIQSSSDSEFEECAESVLVEKKPCDLVGKVKKSSRTICRRRIKPLYYEKKLMRFQGRAELPWLVSGAAAQMLYGAIFPCIAFLFAQIYTIFAMVDKQDQMRESLFYMKLIFLLGGLNFVATVYWNYAFNLCGAGLIKKLRLRMFESMLRQDISYHDQNRSCVLATQLASTIPFAKGLTTDKIGLIAQAFGGVIFPLTVSFIISYKLSIVMVLFIPIIVTSGSVINRTTMSREKDGKSVLMEQSKIATDTVENVVTVKSFGLEDYFVKEFDAIHEQEARQISGELHLRAFFYTLAYSVIFFIQATTFGYGFYLMKSEGLEVTDLFRVYSSITFSALLLGNVYSEAPDYNKARSASKAAFKIINRKPLIDSMAEDGIKMEKLVGDIEFKDVEFCYPTRPDIKVLTGFNLLIKHGKTNALVGKSGCGKSTISSLILRFYDVTKGSILIDGKNIKNFNVQWLRSQIGVVSQEPVLFNMSIKDNILNGDHDKEYCSKEVLKSAKESNISNRIEALPLQYDTIVSNNNLSGGEKKRIVIARALIRNPRLLLLDEATAALDPHSARIVQETLDKAARGRTCIVIAHELNSIEKADKISVVDEGVVTEEGTHYSLLLNQGLYNKLHC